MTVQENSSGIFRLASFGDGVIAGFHSRAFDQSRRSEFLKALGFTPEKLVMVKQVHGSEVTAVDRVDPGLAEFPADGLVTQTPGLVLGIRTADCVPVFLWDPVRKVAGVSHGGWKGVKEGIVGQTLKVFEKKYRSNPKDLRVAFGPSIRKCCYEVGKEFLGYFPGFYFAKSADKGHLDLVSVIKNYFLKRGVPEAQIADTGLCTVCSNRDFFSYRCENQTRERILSVISIR